MKKILCLIDTLGIGGAERQMVGLAVLLKKKGYNVDLVAYYRDDFYAPIARKEGIEPVFLSVEDSQWSKLKAIHNFIKQKHGYDWVITYKAGANAIGCLLKLFGMRFKLIVSERIVTQALNKYTKRKLNLYRFADYVVPNSYSQGDFLSSHYPWMKKKIFPITNFTDTTLFTPKYQSSGDFIVIMTAARVARQKNIINYLEAISKLKQKGLKNVRYEWYGDVQKGEERYEVLVHSKVETLGLKDVVFFYPNTPDIVVKYQQSNIFCLPSNYEGFPNSLCEAMSCGKPVVCSRVCDNERIVCEGENGLFFDPKNVDDIAEKLEIMIKMSKDKVEQWGRRSRELVEERMSEESFVEKYISLIESK